MTNIKISQKGKSLLNNSKDARLVSTAIAKSSGETNTEKGLIVKVSGKIITIKAAPKKDK